MCKEWCVIHRAVGSGQEAWKGMIHHFISGTAFLEICFVTCSLCVRVKCIITTVRPLGTKEIG